MNPIEIAKEIVPLYILINYKLGLEWTLRGPLSM
jgi:hypothetical protein